MLVISFAITVDSHKKCSNRLSALSYNSSNYIIIIKSKNISKRYNTVNFNYRALNLTSSYVAFTITIVRF